MLHFFAVVALLTAKRIRLRREAKYDTGDEIRSPGAHGVIGAKRKTATETGSAEATIEQKESKGLGDLSGDGDKEGI